MDDLVPAEGETLDLLAGDWRIFQLARGHRFSTDDLVVAWRASKARPQATDLLDLGCGIGSVGLLTMFCLRNPAVRLTGIEAQAESVGLARRTVRLNGLADRVTIHNHDLRQAGEVLGDRTFELITGSPPYIPLGTGLLSPIPQRAAARVELRGSVFDYCRAAKRLLAPGGRFSYVMATADARTHAAAPASGLAVVERCDIVFREGRDAHISVITCAHVEEGPFELATERLTVRDGEGRWTESYLAFRHDMGCVAV